MATNDNVPEIEPVAIVGMACRLPGNIKSPSQFDEFLTQRRNAQSDMPPNRFDIDTWYHENGHRPGSVNARGGYFLSHDDSYKQFDPRFFHMNALEARSMDPQQRKLLETVYECFESAGVKLTEASGSQTGCFVGNFTYDAAYDQWKDIEYVQPYQTTGSGATILSNRINYVFNLKGPSFTIDTACSSTMYALHYACQSLRSGDCSAAIVGGTNLVLGLEQHVGSVALGALSPTSTCHTFDASADGYGRADAVGALYIKKLSDAIRSGDPIRAVIRGTAVNANGRSAGISHPSSHQQEAVIRAAYARAGLGLDRTRYFECHGTGTAVGDPIEVDAIGRVFGEFCSLADPLLIGSVKTNIGHGEAASALGSLIKSVLILEGGQIPATIGIQKLNPDLDLRGGAIKICQEGTPWSTLGIEHRRVSVNSFGYGGANAHAILDNTQSCLRQMLEAGGLYSNKLLMLKCTAWQLPESRQPTGYLLPFSAHNEACLQENITATVTSAAARDVKHLAFTLSAKRDPHASRAFHVVQGSDSAVDGDPEVVVPEPYHGPVPVIAFIFTGQGAQWAQMGHGLIGRYPIIRQTLEKLDRTLACLSCRPDWSITEVLREPDPISTISETEKSQTLCTALQVALVDLLRGWGVRAAAIVGHSSGEIGAAYAAGLCSAEDAVRLAYLRGLAAATEQRPGAMAAVGLSVEEAETYVAGRDEVVVACHNSPRSVTLSGTTDAIDEVCGNLAATNVFARKLRTSGNAYHSWLMSAASRRYQSLIDEHIAATTHLSSPDSRDSVSTMISSVTGQTLQGDLPNSYWTRNLVSRVRFVDAVENMLDTVPEVDTLLEIGPHSALAGPIRDILARRPSNARKVQYLSTLTRGSDSVTDMLKLAGELYLRRFPVDLCAVNAFEQVCVPFTGPTDAPNMCKVLTNVPPYQWTYREQEQLEYTSRLCTDVKFRKYPRHDLLGSRLPGTSLDGCVWRNKLSLEHVPWLRDHEIAGDYVFPAAGYVATALEAATQTFQNLGIHVEALALVHISFGAALLLQTGAAVEIVTDVNVDRDAGHMLHLAIKSVRSERWTEHVRGSIRADTGSFASSSHNSALEQEGGRWGVNADSFSKMWFEAMRKVGMVYGPSFTLLSNIAVRARTMEASATVPWDVTAATMPGQSAYHLHPTVVDAAFQLIVIAVHQGNPYAFTKPYIPTAVRNLVVAPAALGKDHSHALIKVSGERRGLRQIRGEAVIADPAGNVLVRMEVELTSLETRLSDGQDSPPIYPYNRLIWRPDFELLTNVQLTGVLPYEQDDNLVKSRFDALEEACVIILLTDCQRVPIGAAREALPFHMRKYVEWVETQGIRLSETHELRHSTVDLREKRLAELVAEFGTQVPELALIARLHYNMLDIVLGRVGALDVMVTDGLLSQVYERGFSGAGAYDRLASVLTLLGHQSPGITILEVGAGSGGATLPALEALCGKTPFPQYREYVFTDVSTAFLSRAKEKFADYNRVSYSLLNIEQDPLEQGLSDHTFDVIIASNVIHATSSLAATLSNCKRLLKPGGRLIMIETTEIRLVTGLLVGQLPGYWLGVDDGRPDGPFISEREWHRRFLSVGLSGADHVLYDYSEPYNSTAVLITRNPVTETSLTSAQLLRVEDATHSTSTDVVYLVHLGSPHPTVGRVEAQYQARGIITRSVSLEQIDRVPSSSARAIIFIELEAPALQEMSEAILRGIQHLAVVVRSALWVTNAGSLCGRVPAKSLVVGLVRSISIEEPSFHVATLDLDPDTLDISIDCAAGLILEREMEFSKNPDTVNDHNFVEKGGILYISRNIPDAEENRNFQLSHTTETSLAPYCADIMADFRRVGDLRTIYWDCKAPCTAAHPDTVIVEISQCSVDTYVAGMLKGLREYPMHPIECIGTVRAIGKAVTLCTPGDRVLCMGPTWLETTVAVPEESCILLSDATSTAKVVSCGPTDDCARMQSLSIPLSNGQEFLGYWKCLCLAWNLRSRIRTHLPNKNVLVELPGELMGHAVCQLLAIAGANVTVTCRSDQEYDTLSRIECVSVVRDEAVWDRSPDMRYDVVLTRNHHPPPTALSRAVKRGGEIVLIRDESGKRPLPSAAPLVSAGFAVQCADVLAFLGVHHGEIIASVPHSVAICDDTDDDRNMKELAPLVSRGQLLPPDRVDMSFNDVDRAAGIVTDQTRYATAVLSVDADTLVPIRKRPEPVYCTPDASYILVGGLGGLGRVITLWMIARGARDLIFLSRSGADRPEAASLVREMQQLVDRDLPDLRYTIIRGDVANAHDVARAVRSAKHPIKGVIHAAMVLKESLFVQMPLPVWNQVIQPKVHGAQNLHDQTRDMDLDFFVMTSTILSVVGAATQSNYAAANAFLDHLARHRHHLGLQATSISIGMVVNVGYVEEHEASGIALRRNGMYGINMAEFLDNLELSCRRQEMVRLPAAASPQEYAKAKDAFDPFAHSNIITGMDPTRIARNSSKTIWQRDARLRHFLFAMETSSSSPPGTPPTSHPPQSPSQTPSSDLSQIREALHQDGAIHPSLRTTLLTVLTHHIAHLVMLAPDSVKSRATLATYGMDSMIGAELRAWIQRELGVDVPFLVILDQNLTFEDLVERILGEIKRVKSREKGEETGGGDMA